MFVAKLGTYHEMLVAVYLEYDSCFQRQAKTLQLTMQRFMLDGKEHWMPVLEQHTTVYSLALLTEHWDKHKLLALSHVFCRGSLCCEASMMKVARLLLRWVCALQLDALDIHVALINQS